MLSMHQQCSGSMTFWCGSGSADPCLWLMDPDPDHGSGSCYFHQWPSRCQQKNNFLKLFFNFDTIFSAYYFLKVHLHHFSKIKSQKESQNSRNQGFSYYFCMMIEGSGSGSRAGSGSILLTSRSGSGRPKNMWSGSGTLAPRFEPWTCLTCLTAGERVLHLDCVSRRRCSSMPGRRRTLPPRDSSLI